MMYSATVGRGRIALVWIVEQRHIADEDKRTVAVELRDDGGWMRANVRWDGGMQIWLSTISEEGDTLHDTFHTYDIREFITRLNQLVSAGQEIFDGQGYWADESNDSVDQLAYYPDETSRGGASPPPDLT